MASKRGTQRPTKSTKAKSKPDTEDIPAWANRILVLVEKSHSDNRATIDAVFASKRELEAKMDQYQKRTDGRLDALEMAVRDTNRRMDEGFRAVDGRLDRMETALQGTNRRMDEGLREIGDRLDRVEANVNIKADELQVEKLEVRVSRLEAR